jgi:hypothetical protein
MLTPDNDVELLAACLGRHRAFGDWDTYSELGCVSIHVPDNMTCKALQVCPSGLIEFIQENRARRLVFWGANTIWLRSTLRSYVLHGFRVDNKWNRLLRINFKDSAHDGSTRKRHLQRARAFKRQGYQLVRGDSSLIGEYEKIAAHILEKIDSELQQKIYQNMRAFACSPQTQLYSATFDGRIVGFVGIRALTPSYAYLAWSATMPNVPYLSDFIYAEVIKRCSAAFETLDLGYGVNEGLFSYKNKWKPTEILAPRHYISFMSVGEADPSAR